MERSRPWPRLAPSRTLRDVFGDGVAYVPRGSPSAPGWLSLDPRALDALASGLLACAGDVPFVLARGASTPEVLGWLAEGGIDVRADLRPYVTVPEYLAVLDGLSREGLRLAMQHAHPAAEVDPARCLVSPTLQGFLNDKANLEALVPARLLAPRRVVLARDLGPQVLPRGGGKVVVKLSTPLPHGGGYCVWICATPADVAAARAALGEEARAVVEEFVPMTRSVCVHAAVLPHGEAVPLGAAEQVCDATGRYRGNWLDAAADVPEGVTLDVLAIVSEAGRRGYRGFAGVDVALADDGRVVVLDLNFRSNGSTCAALLADDLRRVRGARTIRYRGFLFDGPFEGLRRAAADALARGALVPRTGWDPAASEHGGPARATGFVIGASRADVEAEEARLEAAGLR